MLLQWWLPVPHLPPWGKKESEFNFDRHEDEIELFFYVTRESELIFFVSAQHLFTFTFSSLDFLSLILALTLFHFIIQ